MAFDMTGEIIETCSCNALCHCWFGVQELMKMDQGWCDSTLMFLVKSGKSNGVDLAGKTVVIATDFPGPTLMDGNGTGRLHIDETASADQRREIEAIFQGKAGGPMEVHASLINRWLPSNVCQIDVDDDGEKLTARVGNVGEIRSEVLKNEAGARQTLSHAGFAVAFQFDGEAFDIAQSGTKWKDPDMPRAFETHSGVRATWTWAVA